MMAKTGGGRKGNGKEKTKEREKEIYERHEEERREQEEGNLVGWCDWYRRGREREEGRT